ncbi:MAG TPA: SAP domain-containing protein [Thermoanaerobaculia bacterium]|nr:SAP domain-containing protein [Thermoanaerobaculia bacterium]HUM29684.1 SAP domain-containing protein [Thermoanaerobaculia bacterium]HXK66985.1 SAP domain-containing protein [Thermoanaerobaculia bacterium]
MNIKQIQEKARELGITKIHKVTKANLIRSIQTQEKNFPCYGTARDGHCDRTDCIWLPDCIKESKHKH